MTEADVRALRDRVYGKEVTDSGWATCRKDWMRPQETHWLHLQLFGVGYSELPALIARLKGVLF
jgi:hypothetical protein